MMNDVWVWHLAALSVSPLCVRLATCLDASSGPVLVKKQMNESETGSADVEIYSKQMSRI